MKPTNHLRFKLRNVRFPLPNGDYITDGTKEKILQQFWCYDNVENSEYLDVCGTDSNWGEWRDIETVKEEK